MENNWQDNPKLAGMDRSKLDMLQQMEAIPLFADHYDRARAFKTSRSFSDTLPWLI